MKQHKIFDNTGILLFISAVLLNSAYLYPVYFFWGSFFYLVPLFYITYRNEKKLSFKEGFMWGLLFFSVHLWTFFILCIEQCSVLSALAIYFFLLVYFASYSAFWFLLTHRALIMTQQPVIAWSIATGVYIFSLETYGLCFLSVPYGYPFASPLIPLAQYPRLLSLLPYLSRWGLLLALVLISAGIASLLVHKKRGWALLILGAVPFLWGIHKKQGNDVPDYIYDCAVIVPPDICSQPLDTAQEIAYKLAELSQQRPTTKIIFMPESAYPFVLDEEMIQLWGQQLPKQTLLIVGAHRKEGRKVFNSLYCIKDSRIINSYDKSFLFPLTEYLPTHYKTWKNLFLTHKEPFTAGTCASQQQLTPDRLVYPVICCEIFFNPLCTRLRGKTLLVCVNENWFMDYMKRLMYLRTVMIAYEYQNDIIWVSYSGGIFIHKSGFQLPLFTV